MNPPNNIQNGFFTPVSHFFSKIRRLTVFSRNPHTPIIPQSVRLRMGRGRVIRAEKSPFVPLSRRPACSPRPEFSGNKKNHMPGARGACRAYDGGFGSIFPPRTPSTAAAVPLPRRGRSLGKGSGSWQNIGGRAMRAPTTSRKIATARCVCNAGLHHCNRRLHRRPP